MALKLKGSTSGFVGLDAPEVAGNNTLILPESAGLARQVLANDITAGVTVAGAGLCGSGAGSVVAGPGYGPAGSGGTKTAAI